MLIHTWHGHAKTLRLHERVLRRHWRWLRQSLTQEWGRREPDGSASPLAALLLCRDRAWFTEVQKKGRLRSVTRGLAQAIVRHAKGGRRRAIEDLVIEIFGEHWKVLAWRPEAWWRVAEPFFVSEACLRARVGGSEWYLRPARVAAGRALGAQMKLVPVEKWESYEAEEWRQLWRRAMGEGAHLRESSHKILDCQGSARTGTEPPAKKNLFCRCITTLQNVCFTMGHLTHMVEITRRARRCMQATSGLCCALS